MREQKSIETTKSSEWFDATLIEEKPSFFSGLIFVWIFVILIFATVAFASVETWSLGFLTVGVCLLGVIWMADSVISKQFRFSLNPLQLPIVGLLIIGIIQILPIANSRISTDLLSVPVANTLSFDPNITRLATLQIFLYLLFFSVVLAYLTTQKRIRRTAYCIITFGAIWSFFGIIQWMGQTNSYDQFIYGIRRVENAFPFASFINKHHFAAFMEMTVGISLSLLFYEFNNKVKALLLIIAIIIMGSGILLTGSRGGLLSLLVVITFIAFLQLKLKKDSEHTSETAGTSLKNKLIVIGGSIGLILIIFLASLFFGGDSAIMRGTGVAEQQDISTGRFHFWQTALQIIKENPVIGTGLDSFGVVFTKYDTWNGAMRVEQAHNDYLQIMADAGVLGIVCIVAFIFLLFKQGFRIINKSNDRFRKTITIGALAGCLGIIFHSFFDFPLRSPSNAYFFLVLAALATASINYPKLYKK